MLCFRCRVGPGCFSVEGEVVRAFAFGVVCVLLLRFWALYRALVVGRVLERCCNGR
jgi:hypothetical protein